jgi:hypothetical protein
MRGWRGWGSSAPVISNPTPDQIIRLSCDYQQNAIDSYPWQTQGVNSNGNAVYEIEAAGADMFLNWVYRSQNYYPPAFQNINWGGQFACLDTLPLEPSGTGDVLFNWMSTTALLPLTSFFQP